MTGKVQIFPMIGEPPEDIERRIEAQLHILKANLERLREAISEGTDKALQSNSPLAEGPARLHQQSRRKEQLS